MTDLAVTTNPPAVPSSVGRRGLLGLMAAAPIAAAAATIPAPAAAETHLTAEMKAVFVGKIRDKIRGSISSIEESLGRPLLDFEKADRVMQVIMQELFA